MRMLFKEMSRAWNKWLDIYLQWARDRSALGRAAVRIRNLAMFRGWNKWREIYADASALNNMSDDDRRRVPNPNPDPNPNTNTNPNPNTNWRRELASNS